MGRGGLAEALEDPGLDVQAFGGGLDDEVRVRRGGLEVGAVGQGAQRRVRRGLVQLALGHPARRPGLELGARGVQPVRGDVLEGGRIAGQGRGHRDLPAHGPGADDQDRGNVLDADRCAHSWFPKFVVCVRPVFGGCACWLSFIQRIV